MNELSIEHDIILDLGWILNPVVGILEREESRMWDAGERVVEAEECWEPPVAGRGKDGFSLPPSKGAQPSQRCAGYRGFPGGQW